MGNVCGSGGTEAETNEIKAHMKDHVQKILIIQAFWRGSLGRLKARKMRLNDKAYKLRTLFETSPVVGWPAFIPNWDPKSKQKQLAKRNCIFTEILKADQEGNFYIGLQEVYLDGTIFKSGLGSQEYKDGSVYEGFWYEDLRNGYGRLIQTDGSSYEGDWQDDVCHGYGVFRTTDGYIYEGQWAQDQRQGQGKEQWPNGSTFEGEFNASQKNGIGHFMWSDGSFYQGNFEDNLQHGQGNYHYADLGKTYEGEFMHGKIQGLGSEQWKEGKAYEGYFLNGKKNGEGIMHYPQTCKAFAGQWKDSTWHGTGVEINFKAGNCRMADWRNGKLIRWVSKTIRFRNLTPELLFSIFREDYNISQLLVKLDIEVDYASKVFYSKPRNELIRYSLQKIGLEVQVPAETQVETTSVITEEKFMTNNFPIYSNPLFS